MTVAILKRVPITSQNCYTIRITVREKLFMNVNSFSLVFVTWVRLYLVRVGMGTT